MGWEETSRIARVKSVKDWLFILKSERNNNTFLYDILFYIYKKADNYSCTSTQIGKHFGCSRQKIEGTVRGFAKKLIRREIIEEVENDEGGKRYWNVPFTGKYIKNKFYYILREELVLAFSILEKEFDSVGVNASDNLENDFLDQDSIHEVKSLSSAEIKTAFQRAVELSDNDVNRVRRDARCLKTALERADYKCQISDKHATFQTKHGNTYMEGHHLIPCTPKNATIYYNLYKINIDSPDNIVCLCPMCHRAVHYGNTELKKRLLGILYEQQNEKLEAIGLHIDFDTLLSLYGVDI